MAFTLLIQLSQWILDKYFIVKPITLSRNVFLFFINLENNKYKCWINPKNEIALTQECDISQD